MIVYKYLAPERIDVLQNARIRFTQPIALNDPFEATFSWEGFIEEYSNTFDSLYKKLIIDYINMNNSESNELIKDPVQIYPCQANIFQIRAYAYNLMSNHLQGLHNSMRKIRNEIGFLSLTENKNHLLMWSHYASQHQGFVLGFDSESFFFQSSHEPYRLLPVEYSELRISLGSKEFKAGHAAIFKLFYQSFFAKGLDWSYEQELRMTRPVSLANHTISLERGAKIHLFDYPREMIKEVIFGCRMSKFMLDKISRTIKSDFPHVRMYKAELSATRFSVVLVPM